MEAQPSGSECAGLSMGLSEVCLYHIFGLCLCSLPCFLCCLTACLRSLHALKMKLNQLSVSSRHSSKCGVDQSTEALLPEVSGQLGCSQS